MLSVASSGRLWPRKVVTISADDGDNYFVRFGAHLAVFFVALGITKCTFLNLWSHFLGFRSLLWAIFCPEKLSPSAPTMVTTILSDSELLLWCFHYLGHLWVNFLWSPARFFEALCRSFGPLEARRSCHHQRQGWWQLFCPIRDPRRPVAYTFIWIQDNSNSFIVLRDTITKLLGCFAGIIKWECKRPL